MLASADSYGPKSRDDVWNKTSNGATECNRNKMKMSQKSRRNGRNHGNHHGNSWNLTAAYCGMSGMSGIAGSSQADKPRLGRVVLWRRLDFSHIPD